MSRISVLLATEDSYPYRQGDTSTWCDALTHELSDVEFRLLAVTSHPYLERRHRLPSNVAGLINLPLSGMEDPAEYGAHGAFPDYVRRRWSLSQDDITRGYLPHYEQWLRGIASGETPPRALALTLLQMHLHLRYYDYDLTHRHPAVWETFVAVMQDEWRAAYPLEPSPTIPDLAEAWRWLYRLMLPLAFDVPAFDLAHAAAPAFCGLPCVMAKLRHHTPYLLTEQTIYLRDQYLMLERLGPAPFVRVFLARLINAVVDVNYALADQISPVCQYNSRWLRWRGVEASRIRIIYNGVDPMMYGPAELREAVRPTVVSIAPLSPLHAQLDLIEAAALVRRALPDVQFRLHGSADDRAYQQQCGDLVRALALHDTVVFAPEDDDATEALQRADVFALASVSGGFPSSVIKAMLSEIPIVATDVGGLPEAVGETALLVPPRDPAAMAESIVALLRAPESSRCLGQHARTRASHWFTQARFADAYRRSYERLIARKIDTADAPDIFEEPQDTPADRGDRGDRESGEIADFPASIAAAS